MNDNEMMRRVAAGIQNQSFGKLLGLQVEEAEEGRVVISCQKRDDLLQQTGLLHGGVTGAFLRAITTDKAYAVAKVIKRGKQLLVMDVEAFNEGSDKVAAKMIFTGTPTQG